LHTLNIIGAGNLGRTLARLWSERQLFRIGSVCNRSLSSARAATAFIGAGSASADIASMAPADLWLIATPDDHIESVARALATHLHAHTASQPPIVFHCSGALPASALSACTGSQLASAHPVHSFANPAQSVGNLPGSFVALEGDPHAREQLEIAFTGVDCTCITLNPQQKVLYHTGSVMACNYLTVLLDLSLQTFAAAGIEDHTARQLLEPIVLQTAKNNFALGPEKALTGPLVRGDIQTVSRQLDALTQQTDTGPGGSTPSLAEVYRLLGKAALPLAQKAGLNPANARKLETLLDNHSDNHSDNHRDK